MQPFAFSDHPYASFLHRVEKPARYAGGEAGQVRKDWGSVRARFCLAFPDVYDIGMSHLGYKILYKILNDDPDTLAERCYAPWIDMEAELRARNLPLVSLESARPLRDFDVVGLSLQYELTYTNCLTILDLGGIPLRARDRGERDPLVVAGGPTATHPEPVAPFFDAIVVGDGEEVAKRIALLWVELRDAGIARPERLRRLSRLPGVYVPSLYTTSRDPEIGLHVVDRPAPAPSAPLESAPPPFPIVRAFVPDLARYPFPDDGPIGGPEAIFDRMSIEIARGCTEGCRFCQAGMIYRPVRERDPAQIVDTVVNAVKRSGFDEVSLTSLSTADYSCISPLIKKVVEKLEPENVSLGVSSLRAYGLEEDLLDEIGKVRATGLTFAPEAGTQRMRDVINKNVTEEQLLETAHRVFSRGWNKMKLYFIIGLPTEQDDDVRGIVATGAKALAVGKRLAGNRARVTVSVSSHVPKPHTPFQWCAMDAPGEIARKQRLLEADARAARVDLKTHGVDESMLEGVFARGDRPLADVIELAWKNGARFDSWQDRLDLDIWRRAFEACRVDVAPYLGTLPVTARLPWDHIDVGLDDGFLAKEYRKALKNRLSPPCGKQYGRFVHYTNVEDAQADRRPLVCYDCGVACDLTQMRTERIEFLEKMGAHRRLPIAPPENEPAPPAASRDRDAGDATAPFAPPEHDARAAPEDHAGPELHAAPELRAPPELHEGPREPAVASGPRRLRKPGGPAPASAPVHRYRFAFAKLGAAALLGHLDLIRALARVFRRAGLRVAYSRGFHPKPDLTFSPALSLGVLSLGEYVDVKLEHECEADAEKLAASLTAAAPEGLIFTGAVALGPEDAGITKVIASARYLVVVARSALAAAGGDAWLEKRVGWVLEQPAIRVRRQIEALAKYVDVRSYLLGLALDASDAPELLRRAGLVGDLAVADARVRMPGSGGVKASEIAEVLFDGRELPYRLVRVALDAAAPDGATLDPMQPWRLRRARVSQQPESRVVVPSVT